MVKVAIDRVHVSQHLGDPSAAAPSIARMTTSPARRERMSRVDTAWLRMDNDVNLMMIVGVWLLASGDLVPGALPSASRTS